MPQLFACLARLDTTGPTPLEWVRGWFDPLAPFFGAASQAGEAMLVWLD
ncbi:YfbM family protein [Streptomyces sp. ASQP_92]|nr:YfbM family protein [Streptomyces sp. ASQP_92]MCT9093828.1 YfbM family protein [Streptomyces sp. ASQP_92]